VPLGVPLPDQVGCRCHQGVAVHPLRAVRSAPLLRRRPPSCDSLFGTLCPVARLALRASAFLRRARRACAPSAHAPRPAPPQASDNHKHPQQPW